MLKHIVLCFFILVCTNVSFAQESTDSEHLKKIREDIDARLDKAQDNLNKLEVNEAYLLINDAIHIADQANDVRSLALAYSKQAKLNLVLNDIEKAEALLLNAVKMHLSVGDKDNLIETYKTYAQVLIEKKEFESALGYINKAVSGFRLNKIPTFLAEALLINGQILVNLKKTADAELVLEEALKIGLEEDAYKITSKAHLLLAQIHLLNKNSDAAIAEIEKGNHIANKYNYLGLIAENHKLLSEYYKLKDQYDLAFIELNNYVDIKKLSTEINKTKLAPTNRILLLNSSIIGFQDTTESDMLTIKKTLSLTRLTSILSFSLILILSLLTLSLYRNNRLRYELNDVLLKKNARLTIAKENAELVSEAKANFLSTVTHELRTPLYAVTGLTSLLLEENPKEEQVQHLKSLKYSGEYLLNFINDILQINKIEANKVQVENEVFNLKQKISNTILSLNNQAKQNETELNFNYDSTLTDYFFSDQVKITQILVNLIGNAIKFTKNGTILVDIKKISESDQTVDIQLVVKDTGIGMSEDIQKNLFDSFSQGSIQINRKYGGTGLGLSIVKGLLELLKGTIRVESQIGKGSTFYVNLPLQKTDQNSATENEEMDKRKTPVLGDRFSKLKILVVEDNKINQMITAKILKKINLDCDIVENGEDAIIMSKTINYDVILMDIHMPGISGIEATKQIRAFDKKTTIFALTAITIEDKMSEFEEAGFDDIISKPFKQDVFEKKLYNAIKNNGKKLT